MGVQFNLLPDVKLEFDRQQRTKHLVYTLSFLAGAVVLALVIVSFVVVNVLQKKLLSDTKKDIAKYSKQLKDIPDLDKVLTVQNQLNALPAQHEAKHISSRFFVYLPQITPSKIFIGQVTLDLNAKTMIVTGTTDKLETINAFVDTLKFTHLKTEGQDDTKKLAFTNVVLTSSGRNDKNATYSINTSFDRDLFDGAKDVSLVVPKEITTRSVTQSPDINSLLFNGDTGKPKEDQQGAQ